MKSDAHYYDILIVGAGFAGMSAAAAINSKKYKVAVLEKNSEAGKKLLLTGNGRCNICHNGTIDELLMHYYDSANFLKSSFYSFPPEKLFDFFGRAGITFKTEDDGRIFPASNKALEIRNTLLEFLKENNINVIYKTVVEKLTYNFEKNIEDSSNLFYLQCGNELYTAKKIIIASGGRSYPHTGSDGSGYSLSAEIGHTLITPAPGLAPLIIPENPLAELSGLSFTSANAKIVRNNKIILSQKGELLITHKGISGPLILDISRFFINDDCLYISFSGSCFEKEKKACIHFLHENSGKPLKKALADYFKLPERLILLAMKTNGASSSMLCGETSKEKKTAILDFILNFKAIPIKTGFEEAMVTVGGISKNQINPKTMESRILKKLFFAGEIIDYDGPTGGYNLYAAFATGMLAGRSAGSENV